MQSHGRITQKRGAQMKNRCTGMAALLLAAGLFSMASAHATPAHGHPAKRVHHHKYVYYPAQQVYYAPANGAWFWLNGSTWQVGANLPVRYHGYRQHQGIPVILGTSRPYIQHVYVDKRYGRAWREKHRHAHAHAHRAKPQHHHRNHHRDGD
jgi:hypothetical protein